VKKRLWGQFEDLPLLRKKLLAWFCPIAGFSRVGICQFLGDTLLKKTILNLKN